MIWKWKNYLTKVNIRKTKEGKTGVRVLNILFALVRNTFGFKVRFGTWIESVSKGFEIWVNK